MWWAGALGFKCFMVHSGIDEFAGVGERELAEAMAVLRGLKGAVLLAHAEDPGVIAAARAASGLDEHPRSYAAYMASRPGAAEERAIETLIALCRQYKTRVHVVHVATAGVLAMLEAAKREELPITAESCPHYLALAAEDIEDGGTIFKCAPPIRGRENREGLWGGLRGGVLDLIASDHSPCPPELKRMDAGDFAAAWGGISGLQLSLPVVWKHAAARGFGLLDIVRWMCEGPARLAGVDAFKGRLAPGYDADIVVWDPDEAWIVKASELEHRHKVTPYDGATVRGAVKATFVRGRLAFAAPGVTWTSGRDGRDRLDERGFALEADGQWVKRNQA